MIMITPAEFEDQMRKISSEVDFVGREASRKEAEELMCKVLKDNGYVSGVKIFEKMAK